MSITTTNSTTTTRATSPKTFTQRGGPSVKLKVWVEEQIKPGLVDWPAVQARLREQGIVVLGGGADEAPRSTSVSPKCWMRMPARSG